MGNRIGDHCFNLIPNEGLQGDEIVQATMPWAGNGIAAQAVSAEGLYTLIRVDGLGDHPKPEVITELTLAPGSMYTCMAAIDGANTSTGRLEVLLGTPSGSIAVLEGNSDVVSDAGLEGLLGAPALQLCVSPGGKYIACFLENGTLSVLDTGFERKLLDFDTRSPVGPEQLNWCGEDAVVLSWPDKGLLVVGPYGDWLKLEYTPEEGTGPAYVVQEQDCVRVVTASSHELLQLVPSSLVAIRSIGSTEPGALLADAASAFAEGDARCDETIRTLIAEDRLGEAIGECVSAAGCEWDTGAQRQMLRAASYGKSFEPSFSRDEFIAAAQKLRILNQLREGEIALPLTMAQYETLSPRAVIDRLAARHMFRLSLDLADYLGLADSRDRVLVAWAVAKVQAAAAAGKEMGTGGEAQYVESDESVRDLIRARLGTPGSGVSNVSYAEIAAAADAAGRRRLATLLLDFEPKAVDQVPILLRMGEGRLALAKALDSGEPDLCYLCLLHMREVCRQEQQKAPYKQAKARSEADMAGGGGDKGERERERERGGGEDPVIGPLNPQDPDADFLRLVLSYPTAVDLLATWATVSDRKLLMKLYLAAGRFAEAGRMLVEGAYRWPAKGGEDEDDEEEEEEEEEPEEAQQGGKRGGGPGLYVTGGALKARGQALRKAVECFREGEKHPRLSPGDRAECAFLARATEEQVAVLIAQAGIENDLPSDITSELSLVGKPVNTTLSSLWLLGEAAGGGPAAGGKRADKLIKEFKVPEAPATLLKVRALARSRDFPALWAFANERRSAVGYRPFAEACQMEGAAVEAKKFAMQKISEHGERIDTLIWLGAINEACEACVKHKDVERLNALSEKASQYSPAQQDSIERALAALG